MWQPCIVLGLCRKIMNKAEDLSSFLAIQEYNIQSHGLVVYVLNDIDRFCSFGLNSLN